MRNLDQPVAHTPEPWKVVGPSQNGHCLRIFADEEYVAIVGGTDQTIETIKTNAALIASAPMMLEALRQIVRHQDTFCGSPSTREIAAQAIKKATGEQERRGAAQ
jgi:hypothetical protein